MVWMFGHTISIINTSVWVLSNNDDDCKFNSAAVFFLHAGEVVCRLRVVLNTQHLDNPPPFGDVHDVQFRR